MTAMEEAIARLWVESNAFWAAAHLGVFERAQMLMAFESARWALMTLDLEAEGWPDTTLQLVEQGCARLGIAPNTGLLFLEHQYDAFDDQLPFTGEMMEWAAVCRERAAALR